MPTPRPTSSRRRLPDLLPTRVAAALVVASAIALLGATAVPADPSAKTRVTVIGDSITASLDYVPVARRYLAQGFDLRSDAVVCRRLVAASCVFRGSQPVTALELVETQRHALGPVVVVNVGYNDWAAVYDVDRVIRALGSAGVRTVVWVTLRARTANYARSNARIRAAARRWKGLVVADWDAYSRGKSWFREDGLHLTEAGAFALARFLRPLLVAGAAAQ
jgi:hypothetical protein